MTTNNLNEALAEIQKSKKSTAEKKSLCFKLGLRPRDVEYLEYIGFFDGETFTFGVEIECFADPSRIHLNARLNNLEIRYEGYNHRDNDHYYKFVSDASVNGMPNPIECVSPILQDVEASRTASRRSTAPRRGSTPLAVSMFMWAPRNCPIRLT